MNAWELLKPTQVFALQVAVSGVLVSGLTLFAGRVLRRCATPLRYRVLFSGVVGLLAIPALVAFGNIAASTLIVPGEEIVKVSPEMLPAILTPNQPEPAVAEPLAGPIVIGLTLAAWIAFVLAGIARLLIGLWRQHRIILGSAWSADWWTDERRTTLAAKLGLTRFPNVHVSPNVPIPMVVGLFRPCIVLPETPATWGQQQWEAVLLHEAAHIARRDPWAMMAQASAVILFWWCPFVHLMARRLNDLREAICDDYALDGPCDQFAYVEMLVESAERLVNVRATPVTVGLIDSARGGLEERISRLLEKERIPMKPLSFAGKLLGASLLAVAFLLIPAAAAFSQAPAKKVQIKIVVDGKEIDLTDANIAAILQAVQAKAKPAQNAEGIRFRFDSVWTDKQIEVVQVKPDPRIEELVRQAEAIKPGLGAEIRRTLTQAKPATKAGAMFRIYQSDVHPAGGKIIVLRMEPNGKVVQVPDAELKKILEKKATEGVFYLHVDPKAAKPSAPKEKAAQLELTFKPLAIEIKPGPATKKTTPPLTMPDIAELSRQIDRLNRELQELRSRLDVQKKTAK